VGFLEGLPQLLHVLLVVFRVTRALLDNVFVLLDGVALKTALGGSILRNHKLVEIV
jgi:hypothetical protein